MVASLMPASWNRIAGWLQQTSTRSEGAAGSDEPTTLPEGTVGDLVADDEGDHLTDEGVALHMNRCPHLGNPLRRDISG